MWIVKLTNTYRVLCLNLTFGASPIILHTNMKILERWPGFCSLSIFSNSRSHLSIPSIFCTALLTGLSCICGMPQLIRLQTLVSFSVYCLSLDVELTSSLSQQVLAHTKATHRQHLFFKNGIALKIDVPIRHQPSEKISF